MSLSPKKEKNKPNRKPRSPRKLQTRTVTQKLEIIEMRDNGARWSKIAQEKEISESTVRSIYGKKDEIRALGKIKLIPYGLWCSVYI